MERIPSLTAMALSPLSIALTFSLLPTRPLLRLCTPSAVTAPSPPPSHTYTPAFPASQIPRIPMAMRCTTTQAIIVNVVLQTGRAWELGVERHVCEVQLMLDAWPFMRVRACMSCACACLHGCVWVLGEGSTHVQKMQNERRQCAMNISEGRHTIILDRSMLRLIHPSTHPSIPYLS
jgi:hypothetical protein